MMHEAAEPRQAEEDHDTDKLQLKMYQRIESLLSQAKPLPVTLDAKRTAIETYDHLRCHCHLSDADSLVNLLAKPHLKSLLLCHDIVANRAYTPVLPQISNDLDSDYPCVKIVTFVKRNEALGATVRINERSRTVVVSQITTGGLSERSGALNVGDAIQEINGMAVRQRNPDDIIRALTSSSGDMRLKVTSSTAVSDSNSQETIHVRALCSYSPFSDQTLPCPETGLAFVRGDILRLTEMPSDSNWWEATKVALSQNALPQSSTPVYHVTCQLPGLFRKGLIPSAKSLACKNHQGFNQSIKKYMHTSDVLSYEEVDLYIPGQDCLRPIVLTGANGVGKTELIRQLIRTDPDHFQEPIRITTRCLRPGEVHGTDYLFVTADEFATFKETDSLVDSCIDVNGETTALCLDAILEIMQAGKVALFEADCRNLHNLRSGLLKPYIIFTKPPALDVLQETRQSNRELCGQSSQGSPQSVPPSPAKSVPENCSSISTRCLQRAGGSLSVRASPARCVLNRFNSSLTKEEHGFLETLRVTDLEDRASLASTGGGCVEAPENCRFREMIQTSLRLELIYGHLWDYVLINDDLPVALEQLSALAYRLETEAFWVPRSWFRESLSSGMGSSENSES